MRIEKQPRVVSREKLFALIGAGALVATMSYMTLGMGVGQQDARSDLTGRGNEAVPAALEVGSEKDYPVHENIIATVFWVGEAGDSETNDNIHNRSSVWVQDWVSVFGGIDDPDDRCGYRPCDFVPKENMFYCALPVSDYDENGLKPASKLKAIPWYDGKVKDGESLLKNTWVKVMYGDKTVYCQWEDAGPFGEDDFGYVFGSEEPEEPRAGLDLSPATADYLGIDGRDEVSWQFEDESDVPDGPWKEVVTISGPDW